MQKLSKIIVSIMLSMLLFSCDRNKVFEEYISVENANWKKENVANFSFEIKDTVNAHNIYIEVRNTGDYPNSNLYLFVTIKGPDGNSQSDTVNCQLADKRGKWLGTSGSGNVWDLRMPYIGGFKFAQEGEYVVSYEQAMRVKDGLKGITDVGLRVEKR